MANVSRGSSSVTLDNVDDYLAPSQACVNPAFQPSSQLGSVEKKETPKDPASGNVVVPRRRRRVVRKKANPTLEEESGTISLSRPKKVEETKAVKASMADCLACSGCVTTAETVMMEERHSLKSLRNRLASKGSGDTHRVITLSPNSWADLCRHWNFDPCETDSNFYLSRFTTLLSKILSIQMVVDGNVPLQWAWIDEAQEFCDTYHKNSGNVTKECGRQKSNPPLPSVAIDSTKALYYNADGTSETKENYNRPSPILPVISGSCPALVCLVEKNLTNLVPHLSQSTSPMSLVGMILKNEDNKGGDIDNKITWDHWAIMPCHDKKLEASRKDFAKKGSGEQAVDLVISTQECVELVEEWILSQRDSIENPILRGDASSELSIAKYLASVTPSEVSTEILEPSDLLHRTSSANSTSPLFVTTPAIFHNNTDDPKTNSTQKKMAFSSGGHANYIFRYAAKKLFGFELESENGVLRIEWKAASLAMKNVRSARLGKLLKQHYYEAKLYRYSSGSYGTTVLPPQNESNEESSEVVLHFAIAHGMQTMQRALKQVVDIQSSIHYLEAMACPHGCVNGGGSARLSSPLLTRGMDDKKTTNVIRETPTETRKRVQTTLGYLGVPSIDDKKTLAIALPRTKYHVVPPMNYSTGAVAGERVENMVW